VGIAALATSYFKFFREQLITDADVGRIVQDALYPHPPKYISDLELGFIYASASEKARLGGDFLDVFEFSDGKTAFIVGDLSGHGLEAAAGSSMVRNLFRGFMRDGLDLKDTMQRLNRVLYEELETTQFATAITGTYDGSGTITLLNAGGPPPVIFGKTCELVEQSNLPLAVNLDVSYTSCEVELSIDGVFVVYTDGLSEARVGHDLFGEKRIMDAMMEAIEAPARGMAMHLEDQAIRHAKGKLQDDMAILVMRRLSS
jgi:serine phosphatase RsbU (regulator of sigma subunit)